VSVYLDEDEACCWWAESEDHPGFVAVGSTLAALKDLCREAGELYGWGEPAFD
jgi:predicted RNase H-like HicB family nuclease